MGNYTTGLTVNNWVNICSNHIVKKFTMSHSIAMEATYLARIIKIRWDNENKGGILFIADRLNIYLFNILLQTMQTDNFWIPKEPGKKATYLK